MNFLSKCLRRRFEHCLCPRRAIVAAILSITFVAAISHAPDASAQEPQRLRVAVLQFGTVSWELDVVEHHGLAKREGIALDIVPLSSTNALNVALQSGDVDMVVGDWIWVSRQRAAGLEFTSFPYSLQVGSLLVQPNAYIDSIGALKGKKVGVAGGPVDKSWLLMRAYARQTLNEDLTALVRPTYAAPPLLNELALQGELPALINYWHYAARLEAAGMKPLLDTTEILPKLGVEGSVPLLVWMFDEQWAKENRQLVNGFLRATYAAKRILARSEAEWERIAPLTQAENEATLRVLRERYRQGIPQVFGEDEVEAARKTFAILAREGGAELVGPSTRLSPGTFWRGFHIGSSAQ
jgi:NitT/TauT family transport system substrate-binding protein